MTWANWGGDYPYPTVPFRWIFDRVSRPVPEDADIVTAYTDGSVTLRRHRRIDGYHEAADLSSYQGVEAGDFVVHGLDILRGSVGVSDSSGAMSPDCTVAVPTLGHDARYYANVMRAQAATGLPRALARGIREGGADFRRWDTLASLPLPSPPLEVQRRVADMLDAETARIDTLVAKNEHVLAVLRTRWQSILESRIFSDDATPRPPLWLKCEITPGYAFSSGDFQHGSGDVRLLRGINVGVGAIDWSECVYADRSEVQQLDEYRLRAGDLVLGMDRPWISEGLRVATVTPEDEPAYLVQRVARLRPDPSLLATYLYQVLQSRRFYAAFEPVMTGVSVPHVSAMQIGAFMVPLPSVADQGRLLSELHAEAELANQLRGQVERQQDVLRTRRQALITAAVTGQIEV